MTEIIFAVLFVSLMGLTRCYKTTVFLHLFYVESIRPLVEAVDWATGCANKHGCIVGLLKETGSVFVKVRT